MIVSVALALVNELAIVPGQEDNGMLRLHILGMFFFVAATYSFACLGVVLPKLGMVLVAVQLNKVEAFGIRCPTDIGEVTIRGVARIQMVFCVSGL